LFVVFELIGISFEGVRKYDSAKTPAARTVKKPIAVPPGVITV